MAHDAHVLVPGVSVFPSWRKQKGKVRTYINIFIVFMASGLWHGASWDFICWGLYHAVFQVLERLGLGKLLERTKVIRHLYTCLVVCVGWVFFRAGDMALAFQYLKRMFLPWKYTASGYAVPEIVNHRTLLVFVCAVLGCGMIQAVWKRLSGRLLSGKAGSEKGLSGSRPSGKKQYGRKPAENGAVCLQYSAVELILLHGSACSLYSVHGEQYLQRISVYELLTERKGLRRKGFKTKRTEVWMTKGKAAHG